MALVVADLAHPEWDTKPETPPWMSAMVTTTTIL